MPAKGYQYYIIDEFFNLEIGDEVETIHQDTLINDFVDEEPRSIIRHLGYSDNREFFKYHVLHETFQNVRGRYRNQEIRGYIAQEEFHIYFHEDKNIIFMDSKKRNCKELVQRLNLSDIPFTGNSRTIDLKTLARDLQDQVRGGWFGNLQIADVSTIGVFGPTVGESEEWSRFDQTGELNQIDVELQLDHLRIPVKLMSNSGVVLYSDFSEGEALNLLVQIQEVLDQFEITL
jgi:hypothetical protein